MWGWVTGDSGVPAKRDGEWAAAIAGKPAPTGDLLGNTTDPL